TADTGGSTTFGGGVRATTSLTSITADAAGTTALNGGGVTTTGAQTFNDPVTLGANTTNSSTGSGNATFASTVNGAFGLTVSTGGTTTFDGAVGPTTPPTSVHVTGPTKVATAAVTTSGAQSYDGAFSLGAD